MSTIMKTLLGLSAVALAQTAALAWIVTDRVTLLRTGREIVLPIVPVDPRDLFRGEYVRLGYGGLGVVPATTADGARLQRNEVVYVVLEKKAGEEASQAAWQVAGAAARILPGDVTPDQVVLKGRVQFGPTSIATVRYGIESYFVPQGEGRRLEALARGRKLAVLVAVDKAGNASIKGLFIDGTLQYEEPRF